MTDPHHVLASSFPAPEAFGLLADLLWPLAGHPFASSRYPREVK